MISIDYYYQCRMGEIFIFVPLGDIHWGSIGCAEDRVKEYVRWIKADPNKYWFGMGDLVEAINISDKRFDERQVALKYRDVYSNLISEQVKDLCHQLSPIKDKCLGAISGNHEEKVRKLYHYDYHQEICEKLGIVNLSNTAFLNLHFKRWNSNDSRVITILIAHGHQSGELPGASANGLHRLLGKFYFEVGLMGHCHKKIVIDEQIISPCLSSHRRIVTPSRGHKGQMKLGEIKYIKRLLCTTGSFFQAYPTSGLTLRSRVTTYGEPKLFSPTSLGSIQIHITPFKSVDRWTSKLDYHISL